MDFEEFKIEDLRLKISCGLKGFTFSIFFMQSLYALPFSIKHRLEKNLKS